MVTVYCIETAKIKNFQDESLDLVFLDSSWPSESEAYNRMRKLRTNRKEKRNNIIVFRNYFAIEDSNIAKENAA